MVALVTSQVAFPVTNYVKKILVPHFCFCILWIDFALVLIPITVVSDLPDASWSSAAGTLVVSFNGP